MNRKITIYLISIFCLTACIDQTPFEFEEGNYLIVDGEVSDLEEVYSVSIAKFNGDNTVPVESATVSILENNATEYQLTHKTQGIYETEFGEFTGKVGSTYQLTIELKNGSKFQSTVEEMQPNYGLDSVNWEEFEEPFISNGAQVERSVVNLKVNSKRRNTQGEVFYRYRFFGTFYIETTPQAASNGECDINPPNCSGWVNNAENPNDCELVKTSECLCCECWVTEFSDQVYVTSSEEQDPVTNFNAGRIPVTSFRFEPKYHFTVQQLSLTENAYNFFSLVNEMEDNAGSLFSPSPSSIAGNIVQTEGEDLPVYGLFTAYSIEEKSQFIYGFQIKTYSFNNPLINLIVESFNPYIDCRAAFENSSTTRPDFW